MNGETLKERIRIHQEFIKLASDHIKIAKREIEAIKADLAKQEQAASGITPGPWTEEKGTDGHDREIATWTGRSERLIVCQRPHACYRGHKEWPANARAIIAWRAMHPLIGELLAADSSWSLEDLEDGTKLLSRLTALYNQAEGRGE